MLKLPIAERPSLSKAELIAMFETRKDFLVESFGKVRDFESRDLQPSEWTFWTYVNRIRKTVDPKLSRVHFQLRNLKEIIRKDADTALLKLIDTRR